MIADEIINMTPKLKFVFGRIENFVGKGEDRDYRFNKPEFVVCKGFEFHPVQKFVIL